MNPSEYQDIIESLVNESNNQSNKLTNYKLEKGILYKKENDKFLQVIRRFEMEGVMYMMHDHPMSAHFGIEATYQRTKERYYWKNMRKDVETYVKSCNQCQKRGKPINKNPLNSINIREPFYQIGIDFVGPLPQTTNGNKYIIVAQDYFTKWPEARAVKEATANRVSQFIFEDIICRHGCPKKIISDRGSHFHNELIKNLMEKFEIKHNFSTPYHPKTNGLVERFNKTLCESLAKLSTENKNWDEKIPMVLFAYRTKHQKSTQMKPFYLVYGREENWLKTQPDENNEEANQLSRVEQLLTNLPEQRYRAKEQNQKSQIKQKEYHDKRIKIREPFKIGDKVLYYNAAKEKQWSGKLEEKWKGPYYIHDVLLKGSYQIKELNGKILKTPVNGELLKRYYSRETFEPFVVV